MFFSGSVGTRDGSAKEKKMIDRCSFRLALFFFSLFPHFQLTVLVHLGWRAGVDKQGLRFVDWMPCYHK